MPFMDMATQLRFWIRSGNYDLENHEHSGRPKVTNDQIEILIKNNPDHMI